MLRLWLTVPLLLVGMVWSGLLLGEDKKSAKEPIIVSKRLPTHYKDLGLSQKQKNQIYRIHGKYQTEIQELYDKIKELRAQEKVDCERVLTPAQKARLRELLVGTDKGKGEEDDDVPVKTPKKKGTETKDKKGPAEIKK
jgi:hypothetical protein